MKIAIYSYHAFEADYIKEANTENHELLTIRKPLCLDTVHRAKGCKAVMLFSSDKADAKVLKQLQKQGVAYITTRSAGTDHIDLDAAKTLGIPVAHVPEYSPNAIAEHCIALTLALYRKLKPTFKRVNQYNFSLKGLVGTEINNKVVGICGTGDIGYTLAKLFKGFNAKILLYDIEEHPELKEKEWATYVDKNSLLEQSDIISLNIPLTEDTAYFISEDELKLMKHSAILINTGRGALVNTKAVLEALELSKLAGFAMDVYENEKGIFYNDKSKSSDKDDLLTALIKMNNVIVTAHQAFLTDTALNNMMATTFKNINDFINNNDASESILT